MSPPDTGKPSPDAAAPTQPDGAVNHVPQQRIRGLTRRIVTLPGRLGDRLPGGQGRLWRRMAEMLAAEDKDVRAALQAHAQGRIGGFADLTLITAMHARAGDHAGYERSLRMFDPELEFSPGEKTFYGQGVGSGSLNSFRRIGRGTAWRFEKIYDRESIFYKRMRFAHDQVLEIFAPVGFAPIRHEHRGARLAVVEYDFVATYSRRRPDPARAMEVVAALAGLETAGLDPGANYLRRLPGALRLPGRAFLEGLAKRDPDLAARLRPRLRQWIRQLAMHPTVFSHGDLNRANLAASGVVLDWDKAGFMPYDCDAAYAACFHADCADLETLLDFCARYVERPGTAVRDRFAFVCSYLLFAAPGAHGLSDTRFQHTAADLLEDLARDDCAASGN